MSLCAFQLLSPLQGALLLAENALHAGEVLINAPAPEFAERKILEATLTGAIGAVDSPAAQAFREKATLREKGYVVYRLGPHWPAVRENLALLFSSTIDLQRAIRGKLGRQTPQNRAARRLESLLGEFSASLLNPAAPAYPDQEAKKALNEIRTTLLHAEEAMDARPESVTFQRKKMGVSRGIELLETLLLGNALKRISPEFAFRVFSTSSPATPAEFFEKLANWTASTAAYSSQLLSRIHRKGDFDAWLNDQGELASLEGPVSAIRAVIAAAQNNYPEALEAFYRRLSLLRFHDVRDLLDRLELRARGARKALERQQENEEEATFLRI